MIKFLKQLISLGMAITVGISSVSQAVMAAAKTSSSPRMGASSASALRCDEEALSLPPVAERREFKPFASFSTLLSQSSPLRLSSVEMQDAEGDISPSENNSLVEIHNGVYAWLSTTLHAYQNHLSAPQRSVLRQVSHFLEISDTADFLSSACFPAEYEKRLMGEQQGRIIINSRYQILLESLLVGTNGLTFLTKEIVHGVLHLLLDKLGLDPMGKDSRENEAWVHSLILDAEVALMLLWWHMDLKINGRAEHVNSEQLRAMGPDFHTLQADWKTFVNEDWLGQYLHVARVLVKRKNILTLPDSVAQSRFWRASYLVLLRRHNSEETLNRLTFEEMAARWARAVELLGKSDIPASQSPSSELTFGLPSVGRRFSSTTMSHGNDLVRAADDIALTLYKNKNLPQSGESYKTHCDSIVQQYVQFVENIGLEPDPRVHAAGKLILTDESERNSQLRKRQVSRSDRDAISQIIHRLNEGFKITYDPPEGLYTQEPSAGPNLMGQYGKALGSLDELLYVIAWKLIRVKNSDLSSRHQSRFYEEFKFVLVPMLYSLGMTRLSGTLADTAFSLAEPDGFAKLEKDREEMLAMNDDEALGYVGRTVAELEADSVLMTHVVRMAGRVKSVSSTDRKSKAKPEEYAQAYLMRDLLGFQLVLDNTLTFDDPRQLDSLLKDLGRHFPVVRIDVALHRVPGYRTFHITYYRKVNGIELPHEFQIFENQAEYDRYNFGRPNAWWAYAIKQMTGEMPDFVAFDVRERDLRGNFMRYKAAIAPWTYCSLAVLRDSRYKLIPKRVPHPKRPWANKADVADISGLSFHDGEAVALGDIVHDGDIVRFAEPKPSEFPMTFVSGGKEYLTTEFSITQEGRDVLITVDIDQDQAGTMDALTDVFSKNHVSLEVGSYAYRRHGHPHTRFIIRRNGLNLSRIIEDFKHLRIPRRAQSFAQKTRKVSLHLLLLDRPGTFNRFSSELQDLVNIDTFSLNPGEPGKYRWVDVEVELKELPGMSSVNELDRRLNEIVYVDEKTGEALKLVLLHDIIEQEFSEATVQVLLRMIEDMLKTVAITPQPLGFMAAMSNVYESPLLVTGDVDSHVVDYFDEALRLAKRNHAEQLRDNLIDPFLVHPLQVSRILLEDYGVRDEASAVESVTHDIKEELIKHLLKRKDYFPQFTPERREELATSDINEQFIESFPGIRHRLIEEDDFLTHFGKKKKYDSFIQNLIEKRAVNLTAAKLADREHNLLDIFDRREGDDSGQYLFARKQIEKTLRRLFPLIILKRGQSSDPSIQRVYRRSRVHFLGEFILKATDSRLPSLDYIAEHGDADQNQALIKIIDDYFRWASANPDCLPSAWVAEDQMNEFRDRLLSLRRRLSDPGSETPPAPKDHPTPSTSLPRKAPTLSINAADPSAWLTREWLAGTSLARQFRFRLEFADAYYLSGFFLFKPNSLFEISSQLTITSIDELVQSLSLNIPRAKINQMKPYFGELMRVTLNWLKKSGYAEASFQFLYPNSQRVLTGIFDPWNINPKGLPYRFFADGKGLTLELRHVNLAQMQRSA